MSTTTAPTRRTYGNLQTVRRARLMGVSLAGLALGGAGTGGFFLLSMAGQSLAAWAALVLGVGMAGVLIISRMAGRTFPERIGIRRAHGRRVRSGDAFLVAGPVSGAGSCRPGGLLAEMHPVELTTATGTPFTLLYYESTKTGAVVIDVESTDKSLIDQDSVDTLVGTWAQSLVSAATLYEPALIQVVTEAAIGQGVEVIAAATSQRARLREVSTTQAPLDQDGALLTRRMAKMQDVGVAVDELTRQVSANSPVIRQRVTVSFSPRARRNEDGKEDTGLDAVCAAATTAVPDILAWLVQVGVRKATPLGLSEIAEITRTAFDPAMGGIFDRARAEGDPVRLGWNDAGPASHHAGVRVYEHEDWVSATMQIAGPPANAFTEQALTSLMTPDAAAQVRRVSQFFIPLNAEDSEAEAENVRRTANIEQNSGGRKGGAKASLKVRQAAQTEVEIAQNGAVMYRYAMTITATAGNTADLRKALLNVKRSARHGILLTLRNTYRQTDTAFVLGLGLGLVPSKIATIADVVKESL